MDGERDQKQRIQSMISGRGLGGSSRESFMSEDFANADRLIEEHLDKEQ